jgi:4'-phosphopantetheinyl transferase
LIECLHLDCLKGRRFLLFAIERPPSLNGDQTSHLLEAVSEDERKHHHLVIDQFERESFLLGRGLLRGLLGSLLKEDPRRIQLATSILGKPVLREKSSASESVQFNLSHRSSHLVIALSLYGEVGADVEIIRRHRDAMARRFMSSEEYELLSSIPERRRDRAITHLWVIKEACLKAAGKGLSFGMQRIPASLDQSGEALGLSWQTFSLSPAAEAAVAVRLSAEGQKVASGSIRHLEIEEVLGDA